MHIIHVATEFAPFAKVGGLGDVLGSLSKEQAKLGHHVEVFLPKYSSVKFPEYEIALDNLETYESDNVYHNLVYHAKYQGVSLYLFEDQHPKEYFSRKEIYGEKDDNDRFHYFSRMVCDFLLRRDQEVDVLNLHDWQPAAIFPLYRDLYHQLGLRIRKSVFTIHNLYYQGKCSRHNLEKIGLDKKIYAHDPQYEDPEHHRVVNLVKGACYSADKITTVSPTYAKEILQKKTGFGLHKALLENQSKLVGILNGIDEEYWNPRTDSLISSNYSLESVHSAKAENKSKLLEMLHLQPSNKILVCSISRLVPQKGPELIQEAISTTLDAGGSFVLIGSFSNKKVEKEFLSLEKKYRGHPNLYFCFKFNETLAHQVFAAADLLVIPSQFEPCGLTQLIAMHYGTVPLAYNTGGLADSIHDGKNGFLFREHSKESLNSALYEAFNMYGSEIWKKIVLNCIQSNHSWRRSAQEYIDVYC